MLFDIKGKNIILTGSAGHIGYHLALGLLKNGANLTCIVRDNKKKNRISKIGNKGADIIQLDLSRIDKVDEFFNDIRGKHIHGLINNAVYSPPGQIEDVTYENWSEGIEGVLNIPFYIMQKSIPLLKPVRGCIINIASMYGIVSPDPANYRDAQEFSNPPHYGAGKAGLIQLTRYAATYLARYGIRVNSVSPGPFPGKTVQKNSNFINQLSKNVPLGRIGKPEELLGPILFLLSSASSYITGQNIIVDGGWTIK